MGIARLAAARSTCPRAQVGCVIVRDKQVIATGYNGSPPGAAHCTQDGCQMEHGHCVRSIHAEVNAIGQAARRGTAVSGSTAYVTHTPCRQCQKTLVAAGVQFVVVDKPYGDQGPIHGLKILHLEDQHE